MVRAINSLLLAILLQAALPSAASQSHTWTIHQEIQYLDKVKKYGWYNTSTNFYSLLIELSSNELFSDIKLSRDFALIMQAEHDNGIATVILLENVGEYYVMRAGIYNGTTSNTANVGPIRFECKVSNKYQPVPYKVLYAKPPAELHSLSNYLSCSKNGKIYRYGGTSPTILTWEGPQTISKIYDILLPEIK